jgi:hypothetical protein
MTSMLGPILIVLTVVVVIPMLLIMMGAAAVAVIGNLFKSNAERTHEGSELIDVNE